MGYDLGHNHRKEIAVALICFIAVLVIPQGLAWLADHTKVPEINLVLR